MNKYLELPIHLLRFWYLEGAVVLMRSWRNLILLLEEDLAVSLMWRLILVPMFHDSSIIGRILSFLFRSIRIIIGLFGFLIVSILFIVVALYWFSLPFLAIFGVLGYWSFAFFISGFGLFSIHILTHPHKKVWQVKGDVWQSSWISPKKLELKNLFIDDQVKSLLGYLEITPGSLNYLLINNKDFLVKEAFELAKKSGSDYIEKPHFFVAIVKFSPQTEQNLMKMGLKIEDFEEVLDYVQIKKNNWRKVWIWDDDFAVHHLKGINRGWMGVQTPSLDSMSKDLTKEALHIKSGTYVGSRTIISQIVNTLSQEGNKNVIIVGPPGSGKSSLVKFLAKQIVMGDAPSSLATKRLVEIDLTKLLSGTKTQGDLAQKIKDIFEEVSFGGNIIIVIEEIHNLGVGEAGVNMNLYSLILPYLESDKFQFIATTENSNYTKIIEKNGAFSRLFTKIELPIASEDETVEILEKKAIGIERLGKIKVSFLALKTALELGKKLIHDRVLPDSAVTLLEEAAATTFSGWLTAKTIKEVVSKRVNVPVIEVDNLQKEKLLGLEGLIHQKMIDQQQAVLAVSNALRRSAVSLRDTARPIGSFLFVGPTGVGKTELAKTLAEVYFEDAVGKSRSLSEAKGSYFKNAGAFLRFDMSEYQSSGSVDRLIGVPGEGGLLTESVRNRQYALILLDEFEKADPKILTLFLQVLEDGRLTDGAGKIVDFTNTIIIATSNAASLTIARSLGEGKSMEEIDKVVNDELLSVFKPELINRFDDVVIFKPLSQEDLLKIVRLKLATLQKNLKNQGFLIEFDEELIIELSKRGFDPVLGARPLRRLIQSTIESKLSRMILENKLQKGVQIKGDLNLLT